MVQVLKKIHPIVLILFVTFLAYGQSIRMYFWQDDSALMFKLQHLQEGSGSFGSGIIGGGPYKWLVVPFVPLYPILQLEPFWYFLGGVIMYFFAAVSVYFLARVLARNHMIALGAGLIFASGYIGSDTMWRIINSYQTAFSIIFICITLILYKKYIDTNQNALYILAFFFFVFTMETTFIRSHGIFLLILGLEFFFNFHKLKTFLRMIPFAGAYFHWYLEGNSSANGLSVLVQEIFVNKNFTLLLTPFKTLQVLFIPDFIQMPIFIFLLLLVLLLLIFRNKLLLYALILMVGNYLVYFVTYNDQYLSTTHRYVTPSFIGLSIFISVLFSHLTTNKKKYFLMCGAVMLLYLVLVNMYQYDIINKRSIPARKFYTELKKEIPKLQKNSALFFDVKKDGVSEIEFGNFFGVGSMPETTAIAIYYNIDRYDVYLPADYNELLILIKSGKVKEKNVYTFFYNSITGLKNTTQLSRKTLFSPTDTQEVIKNLSAINVPVVSPFEFNFQAEVTVPAVKNRNGQEDKNISSYLSYLISQDNFYTHASATSSSEWKFSEIRNIIDNNINTSWMGHRIYWTYEKQDDVIIDLKENTEVGAIKLVTTAHARAPEKYEYFCAQDTLNWESMGTFTLNTTIDHDVVLNKVTPRLCKRLKMTIYSTAQNDSPQISEIEVIEMKYKDLDFTLAEAISRDPFAYVSFQDEQALSDYFSVVGISADICFNSNGFSNSKDMICKKIYLRENQSLYSIVTKVPGTVLKNIMIKPIPGITIRVRNSFIKKLTFESLKQGAYITTYSEN